MRSPELQQAEVFALNVAKKAGDILLDFRQKAKILTTKSNTLDVATEADVASEKYICEQIAKAYPSHGILAEERGDVNKEAEYIWVIDPLDGTIDYLRGMPTYGVLLALEHNRIPILGCVYRPLTNEVFSGFSGGGVRKNGKAVRPSLVSSLHDSIIHVKLPRNVNSQKEITDTIGFIGRLAPETGLIREAWEDAVIEAQIAAGISEGSVSFKRNQKWWDFAPGIALLREAGGKVTDIDGKDIEDRNLSRGVVASNGKIHEQLIALIKERKDV